MTKKNKHSILFAASHRKDRAPNQRFRFEQYLPFLEEHGFECKLSNIVSKEDDAYLYNKGNYWKKYQFVRKSRKKRKHDLKKLGQYDLVYVCREALMTGSTFFEQAVSDSDVPMVYDFDDAIWLMNVSKANRYFSFMKNPDKTRKIIGLADKVIAGNQYLADYGAQFNNRVEIIPTTIDTEEYQPVEQKPNDTIVIGWSGSITTIQHFQYAIPFLKMLKEKYGTRISFKVIGDGNFKLSELGIQGLPWVKETEIAELCSFDIGIMPLPDDEWAKGKCGLKGLQYMALEIPTIMSPVGVNTEIIEHGENGYLASDASEWVNALTLLIEDPELRQKMGQKARKTVIDNYSVEANRNHYLRVFKELVTHGKRN